MSLAGRTRIATRVAGYARTNNARPTMVPGSMHLKIYGINGK